MSNINEKLNDLLQHHGIKGMKWDVHRTAEEIQTDVQNGVDAVGDTLDDTVAKVSGKDMVKKELGDVISDIFNGKGNLLKKDTGELKKAVGHKLHDISENVKKRGNELLLNLFGPAKNETRSVTFIEPIKKKS
jgi:hypothetical protein